MRYLLLIAVLLALGVLVTRYGTPGKLDVPSGPRAGTAIAPDPLLLKSFTGVKDGATFLGTFTFENRGAAGVKDMRVACTYLAPSGTALGEATRTIYEIVKSGATRTVRSFGMGIAPAQAVSITCRLAGYSPL